MHRYSWLITIVSVSLVGCTAKAPNDTKVGVAAALPVEETVPVENPKYTYWEKHPIGTIIEIRETSEVDGNKTESTTTYKLLSRHADKLVVETTGQIVLPDGTKYPPTSLEATTMKIMNLPKKQADRDHAAPAGTVETTDEQVTILGKEYAAKKYKSLGKVEAGDTITLTWIAPELPGGIAKAIHEIPAAKKKITSEVVKIVLGKP